MSEENIKKLIVVGHIDTGYYQRRCKEVLEVELKNKKKGLSLSICGNTYAPLGVYIGGGQNTEEIRKAMEDDKIKYAKGMTREKLKQIVDIWDRWHLNDLTAGCEHQRALMRGIRKEKGKDFFYASNYDEIVKISEFGKCPICGYRYGTAWLIEELPKEIIEFVKGL